MSQDVEQLSELSTAVGKGDLLTALRLLNERTSFRYTAVYSCDGEVLRNICFYDRWDPAQSVQPDAPLNATYCGIVETAGAELTVVDVREDERFPWMKDSRFASYCGAPIRDATGRVIGTVCHFDLHACQAPSTALPLLNMAATLFAGPVQAARPQGD